jgi:hypothetical protein
MARNSPYVRHREAPLQRLDKAAQIQRKQRMNLLRDAAGETQLHNEDYVRPWDAHPVSKRAHTLIHTRARFAKAWAAFLANDALPDTWAKTLSTNDAGVATANRNCSVAQLLEHAPHPAWVDVPRKNSTAANTVRRTCPLPFSCRNDALNHEENHLDCVCYPVITIAEPPCNALSHAAVVAPPFSFPGLA